MKIEILDLARNDLIDGYQFYEKRHKGIGRRFLDSLYSDIESLKVTGGSHRKAYAEFHRALSQRFPFAIYYSVEGDMIMIRAVVDCRRSPAWIAEHLGKT